MPDISLDPSLWPETIIQRELGSGESLVWAGKPRGGVRFSPADVFMIPFSLAWGGFAFFWEYMAISGGAPFFFALFGLPFVLVGLYMIAGRFFADALRRRNTVYGVTNERIIIVSGIRSRTVQSFNLSKVPSLTLSEKSDGSGTITAGPAGFAANMPAGVASRMNAMIPRLEYIENVHDVFERIQHAQQSAKTGPASW